MNAKPTPTLAAVDKPRLVLLGRGIGRTHADEIKSLGLKVGDTIRGKEGGDVPGRSWWHEVRLTVLWVGEKEVVYRKQWRANHHPDGWHDDGETANFTLSCREYYFEENANVDAPHMNKPMETNTNTSEAKQPTSAGCISRPVRILGYLATWIGLLIVEFNDGNGPWWAIGVICGFLTAWAIFHDANVQGEARADNATPPNPPTQ